MSFKAIGHFETLAHPHKAYSLCMWNQHPKKAESGVQGATKMQLCCDGVNGRSNRWRRVASAVSQYAKPWDTRLVVFHESNKKELRWRESCNTLNVYLGVVKVIEECDFFANLLLLY